MEKQPSVHQEYCGTGVTAEDGVKPIVFDDVRDDQAAKVLAEYGEQREWSKSEEKAVLRKIDWKVMPLLFTTYALQFYDKAMLSQAALFGIIQDLELTGDRYSFASSIFYLGYAAGTFPAILLMQRFPVHRVAATIIMLWGVCLCCTVVCRDYKTLFTQRFFLGLLEGGVSPMSMLIVSNYYKKAEQGFRQGIWNSSAGWISMFSPLINYGLGHITGGSLATWCYMYLFAGSLTILYSLLILVYLRGDPIHAKGLSERERYIAVARLKTNNAGVHNTHIKWIQVWDTITDLKFWLVFLVAYLAMITNGPLSTFVPLIINGLGFSSLNSLLLVMPLGFVAGSIPLLATYLSSRFANRGWRTWVAAIAGVPTVVAAIILWQSPQKSTWLRLFGIYLLGGFSSAYAVMIGLQTSNCAGYTKKSITSAGFFLGYCMGNFTGPLLFKPEDAPNYKPGFLAVTLTSILVVVVIVLYRLVCLYENRTRDKAGVAEAYDFANVDDLTDRKNLQFRYSV